LSLAFLEAELSRLEAEGLRRTLLPLHSAQGPEVTLPSGRRVLSFSSNDYLGLAADPRLAAAAVDALARRGTGAGASRLVVGTIDEHEALERDIAAWKGAEAALLFNSGWQANVGVIPALVGPGDLVVSDALNHASLIDGARLSKAEIAVTPHGDVQAVERALQRPARRRMVVIDALFSMDGELAPLADLRSVCDRHGAILYVDEAHAAGVFGPDAQGAAAAAGVVADVSMGTLGKALGVFGAYVAGPAVLREYLVTRARSFVFTTALPPAIAAAAREGLRFARAEPWRREKALALARRLTEGLAARGVPATSRTQIVPLILGEPAQAVAAADRLLEAGILARPIRPPTVPAGTSRLRLALTAAHEPEHVDALLAALGR
jgi:8-amino-7-oxononanoate synthase